LLRDSDENEGLESRKWIDLPDEQRDGLELVRFLEIVGHEVCLAEPHSFLTNLREETM